MNRSQRVAVVVCTHLAERREMLTAAIASLRGQTRPPDELLVVVDGDPALAEEVRSWNAVDEVLLQYPQAGLATARMLGVEATEADVVAFLDDDAMADPEWLETLAGHLQDPGVVAAGGASLPLWDSGRPLWMCDEFLWALGCSYQGMPSEVSEVRNVFGGCCAYRRDQLVAVGGYDRGIGYGPGRRGGGEEADLGLRLQDAFPGLRVLYDPAAVIRHHVTAERTRLRYFTRRCWAEGRAKQKLGRRNSHGEALAEERGFARAIPAATLRYLLAHKKPEGWNPGPVIGLLVGAGAAGAGMIAERLRPEAPG